jgi:hypothetical protein
MNEGRKECRVSRISTKERRLSRRNKGKKDIKEGTEEGRVLRKKQRSGGC